MRLRARWLLFSVALGTVPASAVEVEEGKLSINGFGSWAYGTSNHGNAYEIAQPGGNFSDGDFAFALAARISDRAVAAAQTHVAVNRHGRAHAGRGPVVVDFAFGEWRFSDLARLRIGVVKHPIGIFGEVPLVGTLRPFFLLPSGVYGATEVTGAGVRGMSLSGSLRPGSWHVNYDLYGGALTLPVSNLVDKLTDPESVIPGGTLASVGEETKYVVGGRLIVNTPLDGLDLRLSGYGTPEWSAKDGSRYVVGPSLQYLGERLSFRAEYFYLFEKAPLPRDRQRTHAAYAEAAWFVTGKIQVGARVDFYQLRLADLPESSVLRHREVAGTINYWFDPGLVVKLSVHAIEGNRFANPPAFDDVFLSGQFKHQTLATIFGTQFSF